MQLQFFLQVLVGVILVVVVCPSTSQYNNLQVTVPNGFYPAPPPGQFQYLYTPPNSNSINNNVNGFGAIGTTRSTPLRRNNKDKNQVVVRVDNQKPRKKSKKVNRTSVSEGVEGVEGGRREGVKYSYIPIELLSALLNNQVSDRPVEPVPIVPASNNDLDVQLGSGVFIRVPLRFRNTSRQQNPQQQTQNNDLQQQDEDEQVEAVFEDEVIPMSMFEEMLEVDMRRRFNTTNPVFNSPEGARVTLNNLLRLFAPPASLLRRAGNQLNNNENLFMRLLKERYQLSNANNIFNRNLNREQNKN